MKPVEESGGFWCEFPIDSPFLNTPARSCGRPGSGSFIRLCWQHHEIVWARLLNDLYDQPNAVRSSDLAAWFTSLEPSEYDNEEQAAERAKSQDLATRAIASALKYSSPERMPRWLVDALEPLVDHLLEERLAARFGAVS